MSFSVKNYLRTTAQSFLILIPVAYGMAVGNVWIQVGGPLLYFVAMMGYQFYKSVKSGPVMDANMKEATRAKRSKMLKYVSEEDVQSARRAGGFSGQMGEAMGMVGMMVVSIGTFFGATYFLVPTLWPESNTWQRYVVGFLLSMPVGAIVTARSGMQSGAPRVTPSTYFVTERGIIFDQMGRSFILKFPLRKAELGRGGSSVEVEGFKESDMIPHRLRLYTGDGDELLRILAPRVKADSSK